MAKTVNNYISISNVLSLSEGMAFGMRYGVGKMELHNCIKSLSRNFWVLENENSVPGVIARSPASNNVKAAFHAKMVLKDLKLGIAAAEEAELDASMGKIAQDAFKVVDEDPRTTVSNL